MTMAVDAPPPPPDVVPTSIKLASLVVYWSELDPHMISQLVFGLTTPPVDVFQPS